MSSSGASATISLKSKVASIQALLNHFTTILGSNAQSHNIATGDASQINALHILRDTATLIKSHTTKLSLLLITPPFTPSAILKVLEPCEAQVVPAMMSGWQILADPPVNSFYGGDAVRQETGARVGEIVSGFETVLGLVIARVGSTDTSKKALEALKQQVLSRTGILWDACDRLVELANLEIPGIVAKKADAFRAILDDAIEELKEWGTVGEATPDDSEEENEDEDETTSDDGQDEAHKLDTDDSDPFGSTLDTLPAKRTDLRVLHQKTMKELRLISTLYRAIVKHRIRALPSSSASASSGSAVAEQVDALLAKLRRLPDQVDDLAAAFYEGDAKEVEEQLKAVVNLARETASSVRAKVGQPSASGNEGDSDAFATWAEKWDKAVADALAGPTA